MVGIERVKDFTPLSALSGLTELSLGDCHLGLAVPVLCTLPRLGRVLVLNRQMSMSQLKECARLEGRGAGLR